MSFHKSLKLAILASLLMVFSVSVLTFIVWSESKATFIQLQGKELGKKSLQISTRSKCARRISFFRSANLIL